MSDEEAQANGWTPDGTDAAGNPQFSLVDEAGQTVKWSLDGSGQVIEGTLRYESPAADPEPVIMLPPLIIPDAPLGGLDPADQPEPQAPDLSPPLPSMVEEWQPDQNPADEIQPRTWVTDDEAAARGWTPAGTDGQGNQVFTLTDTAGRVLTWGVDSAGNFDPLTLQEARPAPSQPPIPPAALDGSAGIILPPVLVVSSPPRTTDSFDNVTPSGQSPNNPPGNMTALDYANSRPDLRNNWDRAHDPELANDPLVQWILAFGNFDSYLANDYASATGGATFSAAPAQTNNGPTVSPYFDPTPRNVGNDRNGNPVFRQVDEAGNVIQYSKVGGSVDYSTMVNLGAVQSVPGYSTPAAPGQTTTPPPTTTTPGGTTIPTPPAPPAHVNSPFYDNTHRVIAQTPAGPLYMLIDADGHIKTWIEGAAGIQNLSDAGAASMGAAQTAAYLAQQYAQYNSGGGGGGGGNGNGTVVLPGNPNTNVSGRITHPVSGRQFDIPAGWTRVGNTAAGNPVFQLVDTAGTVKEWEMDGAGVSHWHNDAARFGTMGGGAVIGDVSNPGGGGGGGGGNNPPSVGHGGGTNWTPVLITAACLGAYFLYQNSRRDS